MSQGAAILPLISIKKLSRFDSDMYLTQSIYRRVCETKQPSGGGNTPKYIRVFLRLGYWVSWVDKCCKAQLAILRLIGPL